MGIFCIVTTRGEIFESCLTKRRTVPQLAFIHDHAEYVYQRLFASYKQASLASLVLSGSASHGKPQTPNFYNWGAHCLGGCQHSSSMSDETCQPNKISIRLPEIPVQQASRSDQAFLRKISHLRAKATIPRKVQETPRRNRAGAVTVHSAEPHAVYRRCC